MEQKNTHIVYGFGTGILMVVIGLGLHFTKLDEKKGMNYIAFIPYILGMVLNAMAFSKNNDGYVSFKTVFGSCFKATMIVTLVMLAWTVTSMYTFPEMKTQYIDGVRKELQSKPNITDDVMDKTMQLMEKGYSTIIISSALFGTLILGVIFSVIAAAVVPKKGERPFGESVK